MPKNTRNASCSSITTNVQLCRTKEFFRTTHPFNGPLSGTTRMSQYQKDTINLDFTEAREWVAVAAAGPYANLDLTPDR